MAGIIDFYREHKDTQPTQSSVHPITSGAVYNSLLNYYLKTETYSKNEVNTLIALIKQFDYTYVQTLPTASADTMYILYFVPSANPKLLNGNDEFITIRRGTEPNYTYDWELIGTTNTDLSDKCDSDSLGYPVFNENTAYAANDIVFYEGKLYSFNQAHTAGTWNISEVSQYSIKEVLESELGNIETLLSNI